MLSQESCRSSVKRIQSWRQHLGLAIPSSNTGAYCRAKLRIPKGLLKEIFTQSVNRLSRHYESEDRWRARRIKLVDGTGLSMPDTKANQLRYPQNGQMKRGCGFPQTSMVGLFCISTGALLNYATGNKHDGEQVLWKRLLKYVKRKDLIIADRSYGTYSNMAVIRSIGADAIFRVNHMRKISWPRKCNDQMMVWKKTFSK